MFFEKLEELFSIKDDSLSQSPDVVIGLGIALSSDGKEASPQSKAVALKAFELSQRFNAALLFTGGYSVHNLTEARAMEKVLLQDYQEVFLEEESYRTYMNADFTLPILKGYQWKSAIIVAQQWYARRAKATFKKRWAGTGIKISVIKAHSPYGGASQKRLNNFLSFFIWDTLAFIISKIKGYC